MPSPWRKCSSCKKDIQTEAVYYVCSVSTCRGGKTNYAFCSVNCWDAHLPIERHRPDSAGALEKVAPKEGADPQQGIRRIVPSAPGAAKASTAEADVLVVASKVRKYILDRSGMNTSSGVYDALTEKIQRACDLAIEEARTQGRKTVMDRDFH